jgi:hypothetical protein
MDFGLQIRYSRLHAMLIVDAFDYIILSCSNMLILNEEYLFSAHEIFKMQPLLNGETIPSKESTGA